MKTATVTWIYYRNFGTYLQAYALQQIVKQLGHENYIIYDNHFAKHADSFHSLRSVLGWIYGNVVKAIRCPQQFKVDRCYARFLKDYLQIDYRVKTTERLGEKYDAFLCGSDQIWSPYLDFEPYYFLGFPAERKIAYAPSLGTGTCNEAYEKNAIPLIRQFDHLSTREEVGTALLKKYIDKPIQTVVDPTLLLDGNSWSKLTKKVDEEKYLLCYFLSPNDWYINHAKQYAREKGLKLCIFGTNPHYREFADKVIYGGPKEFLSYIKYADIVFTDSFHATIFSIHFHKNFQTFKRFEDGKGNDQNARIYNLFEKLYIDHHFVGKSDQFQPDCNASVNWFEVDNHLQDLRDFSLSYLKNSLKTDD